MALRPPALRAGHLRLLPVAVALVVAAAGLLGAQAQAAEEDSDPLGYVIDPAALDDPATVADGAELFRVGCVSCHGPGGWAVREDPASPAQGRPRRTST